MWILAAVLALLIYSVILHEVSHGVAAYLLGDPTAKTQKRLTLNPLRHVDLIGTIVLPVMLVLLKSPALLGWAKPVPFDPRYFKNPRLGVALVSAAGPLMNFALAVVLAAVFKAAPSEGPLAVAAYYGVMMNVILGVFNLLPIPPMDGSKIIGVFLPPAVRRAYFSVGRFGFFIIFALLYFGFSSHWLLPIYTSLVRFLTAV